MKVSVNGIDLDLAPGTSAIDAVFAAGHDVPYFCSQEYMSPIGACRMCLARVGAPRKNPDGSWIMDDATGQPQIFWFPNLMATCTTSVMEGMVIDTQSEVVQAAQNNMVEMTLINHPLDCPTCDKGGACELQDRSYEYGTGLSRFEFTKRHSEKHHRLSGLITLDRERCIHCKRCVRYFEEVPGDQVLDFIERGGHTHIGSEEGTLPGNFTGNITDICPVGALLDSTSRFRGRNWEYDHVRSTTPADSSGAAIVIDARTGRIERIRAGLNDQVNKTWIDDSSRFGHEYTSDPARITSPHIRQGEELVPVTWSEAAAFIAERLQAVPAGQSGVLIAADSTLEEGVAARALAEYLNTPHLDHLPRPRTSVIGAAPRATYTDLATSDAIVVLGDPTEEVPIIDLRIRDAMKGVPPADLMPHGVPIADLRLKEGAPLNHGILAAAAPYRTSLMSVAGAVWQHAAGAEADVAQGILDALGNQDAPAEARAIAGLLRSAKQPVIVAGSLVLNDPAAAAAVQNLARQTGAKTMLMGPAANSFGLEMTGVLPGPDGQDAAGMLAGGVRALFVSGLDPAMNQDTAARLADLDLLIVHATLPNATTAMADVILPQATPYEREGTYVNLEGRALAVRPAPVDAGGALDLTGVNKRLGEAFGQRLDGRSVRGARRQLTGLGTDPADLPDEGVLLQVRPARTAAPAAEQPREDGFRTLLVPTMLKHGLLQYNPSLMAERGFTPLTVSPDDAARLGLRQGDRVSLLVGGFRRRADVNIDPLAQTGTVILPALPEQPAGLSPAPVLVELERHALEVM